MAPMRIADAAATALMVVAALDERNAPVAMVSRVGTDLSKHGLRYGHAGFAVRDHRDGRWTMVHLLNDCSSDGSGLYAQGLVNFFADDLVNQDARITWLQPDIAERLAARLLALPGDTLYTPRYNLIARPDSRLYQNSTSWVLEHIAAAIPPPRVGIRTRSAAYEQALAKGFEPGRIRIRTRKDPRRPVRREPRVHRSPVATRWAAITGGDRALDRMAAAQRDCRARARMATRPAMTAPAPLIAMHQSRRISRARIELRARGTQDHPFADGRRRGVCRSIMSTRGFREIATASSTVIRSARRCEASTRAECLRRHRRARNRPARGRYARSHAAQLATTGTSRCRRRGIAPRRRR